VSNARPKSTGVNVPIGPIESAPMTMDKLFCLQLDVRPLSEEMLLLIPRKVRDMSAKFELFRQC